MARWKLDRREVAGSLGDLGTLLPLAIGMIQINGLDATALFLSVGLLYIFTGLYFRIPVPVQPMKIVGAYAIARTMSPLEVTSAGMWLGAAMLVLAFSGAITVIGRWVPRSVIRGVQLCAGMLLVMRGIEFMLGGASLQGTGGEPFLTVQTLGPVPVGIVLGLAATVAILLLSDSRRVPAALAVVLGGVAAGLALGGYHGLEGLHVGPHLPRLLPFGLPDASALTVGLVVLALPQLPMTVGNAVIAQHDLSREYFGDGEGARSTPRAWAVSMGLANLASAAFGGMPLCHGAGGLAAHYAFGARTGASNLFIGCLLVAAAVLAGDGMPALLGLLPFSVLGALLVFAGLQLGLMIQDVRERIDLFVVVSMLGIALATNLAIAFGCGFVLVLLFRHIGFRW